MFKMIDDFFLSLEGKKNNKPKAEKIKIDSLGSILYHLYVSGKLDNAGLDGLDGWKDDKEKFKTDLLNDIKTFLFGKWEKPWNPGLMFDNDGEMVNGFRNINGRVYKKQSNVIGLQQNKGKSPFFATLKHIAKNGGTITDKTKVTSIISYVPIYKDGSKGEKPDFMLPKFHSVVNVDYVEGIKKPVYKLEVFKDLELNEYVENFINILHSLSRIPNLVYDQSDRCYYTHNKIWNKNDSIHLVPIKNFKGINEYYSTLFHEITHSTMNPLRFGRGKTKGETTALEYANEELVAEMGAMIICSELGLQYNRQNSITYLKNWLAATKDKDTALIEAYAYACDAAEYLMKNINFDMLLPKSMRDRVAQKTEPTPDKPTKRTKKTGKAKEKGKKQTGREKKVKGFINILGEPEPEKPQKKSKLTNKAVEKGKKSKKVKKQSPVTPPSEPGKPLNIGKQQVKGSTTSAKSQFYFIEDSHNLAQLDEARIESVEFYQLNKEMGELTPRYMMAVVGVPMNYLKKHKLYFGDATGNINLAPIPTKVSKAKDLFKLAGLFVAKDVLRPAMCGVYMDAKNGCMVATDAHILIKIPHNIEGENRILNQDNQVIDELYPAYDAVIPRNCKHESNIDLQALLNEIASMVQLKKLTSDKVLFFSIATPIGEVSFNAFNLYKLINGLMAAGCKTATFKTNGKQYAAVFEDVATGLLGLIMPLNLIDDRFRKTILLTQDSKVTDYSSKFLSGTTEPEQPALFGTDKKDGKVSLSGIDNDPIFTLNYQFNQNFQLFKKGKLKNPYLTVANEKKGAITTTLLEHGINGTVIIRPSTLAKKTKKHYLTNENIIDLPMKFNYPLMISSYYNHQRGEGINVFVQDVTGEGLLMAGVKRDANKQMIVYEILTIHGKSDNQLVNYAKNATYINTKKIKELFSDPSINGERFKKFLDYIDANIIQNFENSKSIDGTTETKTPLKDFGLSKLGSQKKGETYKLSGDLGDFLGEYDRLHYSIVLRGEKGAGKSRLLFQLINAFASENLKAAFLSLEMHPGSSVMTRYAEEYITPDNLDRIDVTDTALNYNELNQLCKMYDVVAIDSWTKLKGMEQTDFDRLQKDNPETIIIAIFQSTTGKVTRGGNMPEYDAGTVIQVNKGGLAECEKNRYTATDKIYSVFDKCLVEIEEEEK